MERNECFDALAVTSMTLRLGWASAEIAVDEVSAVEVLITGEDDAVEDVKVAFTHGRLLIEQPFRGLLASPRKPKLLDVLVRVPQGWKGAVNASTTSGTLTTGGLSGSDLSFRTRSGALSATDLEALTISLRTGRAPISARSLFCDKLALHTCAGAVSCHDAALQQLRIGSLSGHTEVTLTAPFAVLRSTTLLGDVCVASPTEEVSIRPRTLLGRLRTRGVALQDAGVKAHFTSFSGDIELTNNR